MVLQEQRKKQEVLCCGVRAGGMPMEENRKLEEILARIEESERKQESYMRRQFLMTLVMAACCVGVLIAVILAYQNIVPAAQDALMAIGNVTADLGEISSQLTEADLGSLVEHVDKMAVTSEEGIKQALEQINAINIEELNQAIEALYEVISPLANLMSRF